MKGYSYALGLVLITPLGDLVRRRQLSLLLMLLSTSFTIGLAFTSSFLAFEILSFVTGVVTVTTQVLMPLAVDLATPDRRASALSIVFAGLMFGILAARVLAGVIGEFTSWRVVYYVAIGVQSLVTVGTYFLLPDYPSKNPGLTYFHVLRSMAKYAVTEPLMIQVVLINIASSACFTAFWVTLTFLLSGPPYHYSTLVIGLFGLVGMFGVICTPLGGRMIDRLVPWHAALFTTIALSVFQAVQTAAGGINIAAVIIACFGLDAARQLQQVALSTSVLSISTAARSRLNAIFILSLFVGQVMGTYAATIIFVRYGWRACSGFMQGLHGLQLVVLLLRGPHCPRQHWIGYTGGITTWRNIDPAEKDVLQPRNEDTSEPRIVEAGEGRALTRTL